MRLADRARQNGARAPDTVIDHVDLHHINRRRQRHDREVVAVLAQSMDRIVEHEREVEHGDV